MVNCINARSLRRKRKQQNLLNSIEKNPYQLKKIEQKDLNGSSNTVKCAKAVLSNIN